MEQECDHILGHVEGWADEPCHFVFTSYLHQGKHTLSWVTDDYDRFAFCPLCGKRINNECDF